MDSHFLTDSDLVKFFDWLEKRGELYVTTRDEDGDVGVKPFKEVGDFTYPGVRASQPLKPLFFSALEEVAEYPSTESAVAEAWAGDCI